MINQLTFWAFIITSCFCAQPKPLFGLFDANPTTQKEWLDSSHHPYLICNFEFKDESEAQLKSISKVKRQTFEENIDGIGNSEFIKKVIAEKENPRKVPYSKFRPEGYVQRPLSHFVPDEENEKLKIESEQDERKLDNVEHRGSSSGLQTGHNNSDKKYIDIDSPGSDKNTPIQNQLLKSEEIKVKQEFPKLKDEKSREIKIDEFNKLSKDKDKIFRYSVAAHCKAEESTYTTHKCEGSTDFVISVKRFWFIRKRIVIDAKKTIDEGLLKYYLGDYKKPTLKWVDEICTFYIDGSKIATVLFTLIISLILS